MQKGLDGDRHMTLFMERTSKRNGHRAPIIVGSVKRPILLNV